MPRYAWLLLSSMLFFALGVENVVEFVHSRRNPLSLSERAEIESEIVSLKLNSLRLALQKRLRADRKGHGLLLATLCFILSTVCLLAICI